MSSPTDPHPRPRRPLDGDDEVILLVDDERTVRESLKAVLSHRGYRVIVAADGPEGIEILKSGEPRVDLLMTDMMMPFMDGLEVIAAARALRPTLPILAISGIRDYRVKVESFAHPPVLFMAKPFLLDALLATLREALQAEPEARTGS
jgi:CheY-like chemotaxis protein